MHSAMGFIKRKIENFVLRCICSTNHKDTGLVRTIFQYFVGILVVAFLFIIIPIIKPVPANGIKNLTVEEAKIARMKEIEKAQAESRRLDEQEAKKIAERDLKKRIKETKEAIIETVRLISTTEEIAKKAKKLTEEAAKATKKAKKLTEEAKEWSSLIEKNN